MRYCDCPHSQMRDAAYVSVTSFVAMTKYQTKAAKEGKVGFGSQVERVQSIQAGALWQQDHLAAGGFASSQEEESNGC